MVSPQRFSSHLSLEVKIIEAINVESRSKGILFVRYYVVGGNSKRKIGLKTKEISMKNDDDQNHVWNESFSLECSFTTGGHTRTDMITKLKQESFVFELRWRKRSIFSHFCGSKLLGRAEILWKEVIIDDSPNMVLEKWVDIVNSGTGSGGGDKVIDNGVVKSAKLKVEIRVRVLIKEEVLEKRRAKMGMKKKNWDDCECKSGHHLCSCTCEDYHVFALATTFEAF
ncbi:uncharacterized protein LOC133832112 [Humulus lupulus]|uniref:uncharacterized protein LOC133832112 n=1 Tax=Humulus lupulus TaxID=3486 RepID=UPI002B41264F|nr:uncharacterized protein LOC133832112 [Humulus lupulus]